MGTGAPAPFIDGEAYRFVGPVSLTAPPRPAMNPTKTTTCNVVYKGNGGDVQDLHCERIQPGCIASYWKPTPEELTALVNGGAVRLVIYTEPIPPVWVDVIGAGENRLPTPEQMFNAAWNVAHLIPHPDEVTTCEGRDAARIRVFNNYLRGIKPDPRNIELANKKELSHLPSNPYRTMGGI